MSQRAACSDEIRSVAVLVALQQNTCRSLRRREESETQTVRAQREQRRLHPSPRRRRRMPKNRWCRGAKPRTGSRSEAYAPDGKSADIRAKESKAREIVMQLGSDDSEEAQRTVQHGTARNGFWTSCQRHQPSRQAAAPCCLAAASGSDVIHSTSVLCCEECDTVQIGQPPAATDS